MAFSASSMEVLPSTLPVAAFCSGARLELGGYVASGGPSAIKCFTSTLAMNVSTL